MTLGLIALSSLVSISLAWRIGWNQGRSLEREHARRVAVRIANVLPPPSLDAGDLARICYQAGFDEGLGK